jgi:hypothetical protein
MILGAASAGFLIDAFGPAITLGIDAASFFVSGLLVFTFRHLTPRAEHTENTMIDDLHHGWKVFISFSWIVIIAFILSVWLIIRFRISKRNRQMVQWLEYTEAEARRKAQEVAN